MIDLKIDNLKFSPALSEQENETLYLFLCDLIKNNNVKMWYQPQYNLSDREIIGVESLLRWYKNGIDFISPLIVFDLVERVGLNEFVDYFIVKRVCKDYKVIMKKFDNPNLKIAINLTGSTFKNKEIMLKILGLIESYNINSHNIEFELTENILLNEKEIQIVSELVDISKEKGFSVALDDFGVKNSTLEVLKVLNIDTLKIDKGFLDENDKTRKILNSILCLAHSLGLKTVGEGIETQQQEDLLKSWGCVIGQGFYFSRPKALELF